MALEITYSDRLIVQKDGVEPMDERQENSQVTMLGSNTCRGSQVLSVTEEPLQLRDVTAGGVLRLKNHDDTHTVHLRAASGETNLASWWPGECWQFRLSASATAPYLIASGGTPRVSYVILDP